MKPKLLLFGDAGQRTGFERVMRGITTFLHNTGRWDVVVMGVGYKGQLKYPYPVYAVGSERDLLGIYQLPDLVKKHQPDAVFVLQDLWNIARYAALKPSTLPLVGYTPIDCPNIKWGYAVATGSCSAVAAYTEFGVREIAAGVRDFIDLLVETANADNFSLDEVRNWVALPQPMTGTQMHARMDRLARYQNVGGYNVIPHGHDHALFEVRDKKLCRRRFGIPEDAFVVSSVGTNQFRKRLDLTFRVFAMLAREATNARLVMHCQGFSVQGWDLEQLARYLGVRDRVHFIHETEDELTDDDLVSLYNVADVQINTAGGEGWGLPAIESASCGVPQIVPSWSATREIWRNYGMLLPVRDFKFTEKFLNTAHAEIDVNYAGQLLLDLYKHREQLVEWQKKALDLAAIQLTWDQVGERMEKVLLTGMGELPLKSMSLQECLEARRGEVKSELAGVYDLGRSFPADSMEVQL